MPHVRKRGHRDQYFLTFRPSIFEVWRGLSTVSLFHDETIDPSPNPDQAAPSPDQAAPFKHFSFVALSPQRSPQRIYPLTTNLQRPQRLSTVIWRVRRRASTPVGIRIDEEVQVEDGQRWFVGSAMYRGAHVASQRLVNKDKPHKLRGLCSI